MSNAGDAIVLSGDIGGTKTLLGAYVDRGTCLEIIKEASFANKAHACLEDIISGFISGLEKGVAGGIRRATFGVAGPVREGNAALTNLSWTIDAQALGRVFSLAHVSLINDIASVAWSLEAVSEEDLFVLKPGMPQKGNMALIAAGTGLGEAIIFRDGKRLIPSASEGGHADFAPRSPVESDLLDYLSEIHGHVSYERVLSGSGLVSIYSFLNSRRDCAEPAYLSKRFETEDPSAVIATEALHGSDRACIEALDIFVSVYGAEAGNLALKALSVGGVYISGGIAPKILPALEKGGFADAFVDKGRFKGMMESIPVYVIAEERAGLWGGAIHACRASGEGADMPVVRRIVEAS